MKSESTLRGFKWETIGYGTGDGDAAECKRKQCDGKSYRIIGCAEDEANDRMM
jgi:hypothetical protein